MALQHLSLEDQQRFNRFSYGAPQLAPFSCIHHAFEHHAAIQPDAVAVEHLGDTITYAELDRQANILANHLRASGICPGTRVCLLVQRSILMVVGIVAVLKAGASGGEAKHSEVADLILNLALLSFLSRFEAAARLQSCERSAENEEIEAK